MIKGKLFSTVVSILMIFIICIPAYAGDQQLIPEDLILDEYLDELAPESKSEYYEFASGLAQNLTSVSPSEYNHLIKKYCADNTTELFTTANNAIQASTAEPKIINVRLSDKATEQYELSYVLGDDELLTVSPTYLSIETLIVNESKAASTSYKSGTCEKTYYGTDGRVLFSLSVSCTFYYDGSSAWYKSGYSRSYSKGDLSVWQVTNWSGSHSASGSSYEATCSGDFQWGYLFGTGLVIQQFHCENTVICSKSGVIAKITTKTP